MLKGDFERAWVISDAVMRARTGRSCGDRPNHLRWVWDGTPLAGRDVLVSCWHGLGDTLQFIRFVPQLAGVARSVAVEAQPALLPLLRSVCGACPLYPLGAVTSAADVSIESMELPHALRIALGDLPGRIPYLEPSPDTANGLRCDPGRSERLRVGLVWAGGDWRRERSVPPALLLPLTCLPVDLFALQLGPAVRDPRAQGLIEGLRGGIAAGATICETAVAIGNLDLVITIDTMVAHLAGALGRPVWTLLDADADWRWMRHRNDTPWYPTMRLFRQTRTGAWTPVVEELMAALADLSTAEPQRIRTGLT
jgi:hypothetical protein